MRKRCEGENGRMKTGKYESKKTQQISKNCETKFTYTNKEDMKNKVKNDI